jgi:hypothetical protein
MTINFTVEQLATVDPHSPDVDAHIFACAENNSVRERQILKS